MVFPQSLTQVLKYINRKGMRNGRNKKVFPTKALTLIFLRYDLLFVTVHMSFIVKLPWLFVYYLCKGI